MKCLFLLLILCLIPSLIYGAGINISALPDGGSTVDKASVMVGNIGSRTGTTSRFTIAELFGLYFGTLTDGKFCTYNSSSGKVNCTSSGYFDQTGNYTPTGTWNVTGATYIQKGVRYYDDDLSNYVEVKAPTDIASNFSLNLPASAPPAGTSLWLFNGSNNTSSFSQTLSGMSVSGGTPGNVAVWDGSGNLTSGTSLALTGNLTGLIPSTTIRACTGTHSGSNNVTTLSHSDDSSTTGAYIGMTLYNITDGSSCTITASTNTTKSCTLTGGTENDWDTNDNYAIGPGPAQSGMLFYIATATTIYHPSIAGFGACYVSDVAGTVSVQPKSSSMALWLPAATSGLTANHKVSSEGAIGNYICYHNQSTTKARALGSSGAWTDGG